MQKQSTGEVAPCLSPPLSLSCLSTHLTALVGAEGEVNDASV